jgi:succinate dehydrogenase / fumarate reductase iron-sulfur subunit
MTMQMDAEGFGTCTNLSQCEAACPKEIPTRVIAELNRDLDQVDAQGQLKLRLGR